jgi:hypothetical protein
VLTHRRALWQTPLAVRSRPFLLRLGLAALGMCLVCLLAYVGLGCVLWYRPLWCRKLLGTARMDRLEGSYARALGTIISKDSDGDGLTDGWKFYSHFDQPRIPGLANWLAITPESPGIFPAQFQVQGRDIFYDDPAPDAPLLEPGERRRVHARLGFFASRPVFVRGMYITLEPSASTRTILQGGFPAEGPLRVPVAADGLMEFDMEISPAADANNPEAFWTLEAVNGISKDVLGEFRFRIGRRRPPLPCKVKIQPGSFRERSPCAFLSWQPDPAVWMHIVEATRDPDEKVWFTVGLCRQNKAARVEFDYDHFDPRYQGPLQFRVVPIEPSPRLPPPPGSQ